MDENEESTKKPSTDDNNAALQPKVSDVCFSPPNPMASQVYYATQQSTTTQGSIGTPQQIPGYNQTPSMPYNSPTGSHGNITVVFQQPQPGNKLKVAEVIGDRDWSTGIFSCLMDIGSCVFTCLCYPCAISRLFSRTGECMYTPCFVPAAHVNLRTRIRTLGGIQGSMCHDCLIVTCCGPCAACQESRELTNMGIP